VLTDFALTVPGTDEALHGQADELFASGHTFSKLNHGIWDLTRPERRDRLDAFATDYAAVRAAEQRELNPDEVRALPKISADHPLAAMWQERAESHRRFEAAIADLAPGLMVDIGAGSGWLAAHLAAVGWRAAAIDVTVTGGDSLDSARHHDADLLLIRAEMEAMPFASRSVDLAVFNASLHYASSVVDALGEARRILRPGGTLAVLDSPIFTDVGAGLAMVDELAAHIEQTHGIRAAQHEGKGFVLESDLTAFEFARVGATSGLRLRFNRWRGARRAGREIADRPLLLTKIGRT